MIKMQDARSRCKKLLEPNCIFKMFVALMLLVCVSFADAVKDGNKLFAGADYAGALEKYQKAREADPANPILFYNIGTCQYMLGNYDEAAKELQSAVRMPDSLLAAKAAYNLANTHFRAGEKLEPAQKIQKFREALAYLKRAVELAPDFEKAKKNAEIVQRRLKEALDEQKEQNQDNQNQDQKQPEMSDAAKAALARAEQLCKQGEYDATKQVLEKIIAEDETASQLNSYLQRIEDIIDIQAGRKPKAKIDASNADNDLEVI